jgi:hypothetical protein
MSQTPLPMFIKKETAFLPPKQHFALDIGQLIMAACIILSAALIKAYHMKTVLTNVDANRRDRRLGGTVGHGDIPFHILLL